MLRNFADHPAFILILIVLVVLLFGAKRLPDAARSLGRSMRIFKSEVKEMKDDGKPASASDKGTPTRPLEGRVVDAERAATASRDRVEDPSEAERMARETERERHSA